jgi:hypothetical protein
MSLHEICTKLYQEIFLPAFDLGRRRFRKEQRSKSEQPPEKHSKFELTALQNRTADYADERPMRGGPPITAPTIALTVVGRVSGFTSTFTCSRHVRLPIKWFTERSCGGPRVQPV